MLMNRDFCQWGDILKAIREKRNDPDSFQRVLINEPQQEKIKKYYKSTPLKTSSFRLDVQSVCGVYLTPREAQCMALMLQGATNVEVARKLGLSSRTVEFYIKNMRERLDCYSKAHLIRRIRKTDFVNQIDSILATL